MSAVARSAKVDCALCHRRVSYGCRSVRVARSLRFLAGNGLELGASGFGAASCFRMGPRPFRCDLICADDPVRGRQRFLVQRIDSAITDHERTGGPGLARHGAAGPAAGRRLADPWRLLHPSIPHRPACLPTIRRARHRRAVTPSPYRPAQRALPSASCCRHSRSRYRARAGNRQSTCQRHSPAELARLFYEAS